MCGQEDLGPLSFGDWSDLYREDVLSDPDSLTCPFTLEEVKKAIFQLGSDKALRPDGFPFILFPTFFGDDGGYFQYLC